MNSRAPTVFGVEGTHPSYGPAESSQFGLVLLIIMKGFTPHLRLALHEDELLLPLRRSAGGHAEAEALLLPIEYGVVLPEKGLPEDERQVREATDVVQFH